MSEFSSKVSFPKFTMKYPALLVSCVLRMAPKNLLFSFRRKFVRPAMEDHMNRTIRSYRQFEMSDASVTEIKELSPTVIGLKLRVDDHDLKFCAGQW